MRPTDIITTYICLILLLQAAYAFGLIWSRACETVDGVVVTVSWCLIAVCSQVDVYILVSCSIGTDQPGLRRDHRQM